MSITVDTSEFKKKIELVRLGIPHLIDRTVIGPELVRRMKTRFETKKAPDGSRWKARSSKTKSGGSLLLRTGNLRDAITVMQGAPQGVYASNTGLGFRIGLESRKVVETFASGNTRTVDTAVYGRAHQMGDGYVPKRRFIGMGPTDRAFVLDRIGANLKRVIA